MTASWTLVVLGNTASEVSSATVAAFATNAAGRCHILAATDVVAAVSELPKSAFVTFVVAGDTPFAGAIEALDCVLGDHPEADLVYGDSVTPSGSAGQEEVFHRPAWSPERLLSQNYVGSMVTYRTSLLAVVDTTHFEVQSPMQQLHDLALQLSSVVARVVHVPTLFYEATARREDQHHVSRIGVQRHFARTRTPAIAVDADHDVFQGGLMGFRPDLPAEPLVSVVIPTGGSTRTVRGETLVLVDNAVRSLVEHSTYQNLEIVIVVDAKSSEEIADHLTGLDRRVRIVKDVRPFNFAAACNLGVASSSGDIVILLNDDTEVVTTDWIERLVVLASMDGVGAVGVKLLYGDGRLQHGGVGSRRLGADHLYHGYPGNEAGHGGWLRCVVNSFAATGACLAVRRDRWTGVDGMDERFPLNYNDIDFCLRLQARGWRTVVDNQTVLTHLETSSRPSGSETWEVDLFRERWDSLLENNPYDNPNLVDIGLLQIPPPAALTKLHMGTGHRHAPRVWCRSTGFG